MQELYKELNSELLVDIPALYSDRGRFMTPVFATVCVCLCVCMCACVLVCVRTNTAVLKYFYC